VSEFSVVFPEADVIGEDGNWEIETRKSHFSAVLFKIWAKRKTPGVVPGECQSSFKA